MQEIAYPDQKSGQGSVHEHEGIVEQEYGKEPCDLHRAGIMKALLKAQCLITRFRPCKHFLHHCEVSPYQHYLRHCEVRFYQRTKAIYFP